MAITISGSGITSANIADGTITTDDINSSDVSSLKSGRKNLIINGAMRVQQRGTASVTSGYFVDRFQLSGGSASAVLTSSTPTEFPTAISVSATSGNPIVIQKIESESCQHLSGQTVTASFYAKNISNATTLYAKLVYAGSVDNFGSSTTISEQNLGALSGSWVKYTASWTVPSGGLNGLMLNILCDGTSTFTMGVTGIQLELGSVATDFEHRSYGEELALCKRYFEKSYSANIAPGTSGNFDGDVEIRGNTLDVSSLSGPFRFSVEKRATPTVTLYSPDNGATGTINRYASGTPVSITGIQHLGTNAFARVLAPVVADAPYRFHWTADAEL